MITIPAGGLQLVHAMTGIPRSEKFGGFSFGTSQFELTSSVQTLDGELVVQDRKNNAVVFGFSTSVYNQCVALIDSNARHAVALHAKQECRFFVTNQVVV